MSSAEFAQRIKRNPIAILPLGATEQHGCHLPLGVDSILAEEFAQRLAEEIDAVALPCLPYGYSWVWRDDPGTVTLSNEALEAVIRDIVASLQRHGVLHMLLLNCHEANASAMKSAARKAWDVNGISVWRLFYPGWQELYDEVCESQPWHGIFHADEFETSLMLAIAPELVDMAKAVREYPTWDPAYFHGGRPLGELSTSGVFGDATAASRDKGELLLAMTVAKLREAWETIQDAAD